MSHFCEKIFKKLKRIEVLWKQDERWGNRVQFLVDEEHVGEKEEQVLVHAMIDVFMTFRLSSFLSEIIQRVYYFENETEVNRILDVTQWILRSDDAESKLVRKSLDVQAALQNLFQEMIRVEKELHFDSIVQFRCYEIQEMLIEYVGRAIDEVKREEDHQAYVHMLREYVTTLEEKVDEIHVVQGSPFTFFKKNGKRYARFELRAMMHASPLYLIGLDADEFNLAPLIACAPKQIFMYGDDPSDPKTLTIMNVFQERVTFYPTAVFPFTLKKNQ